jgi:hypothetical protein
MPQVMFPACQSVCPAPAQAAQRRPNVRVRVSAQAGSLLAAGDDPVTTGLAVF